MRHKLIVSIKNWSYTQLLIAVTGVALVGGFALTAHSELKNPDEKTEEKVAQEENPDYCGIQCLLNRYPEISWLTQEASIATPHQGLHYSTRFFQKEVLEFDCLMMAIHCLNIFLNGKYEDYLQFVSLQAKGNQLQWQSFVSLQNHILGVITRYQKINDEDLRHVFEYALILNEVGKSDVLFQKLRELGENVSNREEVVQVALKRGEEVLPSYSQLTMNQRQLLSEIFQWSDFDQIIRLEGGPDMFTQLKESNMINQDPLVFEMGFFIYTCRIAAILGHINAKSSLIYNEDLHQCLMAVKSACYLLKEQNEMAAYNHYLSVRANWLGLDAGSPLHRVLTRIGAMLMLYKPEEGKILKESLLKLRAEDLALVVEEFNMTRKDLRYRIPTCLSSVLINLSNNTILGDIQKERLEQTISIGLPFLAKVLRFQKDSIHKNQLDRQIPLNFDNIAKVAQDEPNRLKEQEFHIDDLGNVTLP
ncbi:MAG: hypothetical protein K9M07_07270 [Simkaniaceae bacterium]|nr:hypothetical protein [Simkaniaceae bacterium]